MKKLVVEMKITELYLPEEANFIAMDKDGMWLWFINRPHIGNDVWMPGEREYAFSEGNRYVCRSTTLSKNEWKDSLIEL
jgi:hypothetical protein